MKKRDYYLGCHVSMNAPGQYLIGSVKEAVENGCDTFMFFTGAPQNTNRAATEKLNIEDFRKLLIENDLDINKVIVHGPYTINMANTIKPDTYKLGVRLMKEELERLEAIGVSRVVLHPGAAVGAPKETALLSLAKGLNEVFDQVPNTPVKIALETMSGKGTEICTSFEEIKTVFDNVKPEYLDKLGVCFDTCHLSDAGYDVKNDFDGVLNKFDEIIGLDKLLAIHLNDSKNEMGAHKDRHANIGYGHIGFETLKNIVHHEKISEVPIVLETPWIDKFSPYKHEISMLREKTFIKNDIIDNEYNK